MARKKFDLLQLEREYQELTRAAELYEKALLSGDPGVDVPFYKGRLKRAQKRIKIVELRIEKTKGEL